MRSRLFFKLSLILVCILPFSLSACITVQVGLDSAVTPTFLPTENLSTAALPLPVGTIVVPFVKDGNLQVWDDATQQTRTLVDTGDVSSVTVSEDGRTIAFTRRSWVGDVADGYEQLALWTMDRDGGNPRELVSAQDLRQWIDPSERESSNFFQLGWVPGSHRLIFSGTKYIVQAEGLSHAIPQGTYLVDTDQGPVTVLADATENMRFVPSPDGQQIALLAPDSIGFINTDGSNRRQGVLVYPAAGVPGPLFPTGAWTRDSQAFVATGSFAEDPASNVSFTIWRFPVPMDSSAPEDLVTVTGSQPSSVTFSPDGKSAAFLQTTDQQPAEIAGWSITPLTPGMGQLAIPYYGKETSYANVHWSPAGEAFTIKERDLFHLCPGATQDSQVCGEPIHLGSRLINALQWMDASRFVFEGSEPNTLSLGKLDGTVTPIATWAEDDLLSGWSFYIVR
jgi:dipeptidyl aminopeptidase/acylaminoacyl peptidase